MKAARKPKPEPKLNRKSIERDGLSTSPSSSRTEITSSNPAGWTKHERAFAVRVIELLRMNEAMTDPSRRSTEPINRRIRPKAHIAVADIFLRKVLRLSNEMSTEALERWITLIER